MHHVTPLSRRNFLSATLAAALAGCAHSTGIAPRSAGRRPNVVLVLVDDLGWADVGCNGSRYFETPHIDRLASQGIRFTDAYAACAVCSPTRAAVMTGRYPARIGITDWVRSRFQKGVTPAPGQTQVEYVDEGRPLLTPQNRSALELDEITIAELLKSAGYATCHIGKWHLGTDEFYPDRQGFDINLGGCDFGQPPTYYDPYSTNAQGAIHNLPGRKPGEYLTDREADEAVKFIRDNQNRPFFLNLCHYAVHTPIQAKKELLNKYKAKTPTEQKNPAYATMVESVDQSMGRILTTLDELGIADNTMVIFTSDNGGLLGPTSNAPLRSGKGYPYEGGIRVPLVIRYPGTAKAGSVSSEPATSVDLLPTLCQAVGVPRPSDRPIDGASLMPALRGGQLGRDAIYWHFPHYRHADVVPYSIIRAGDWKLIKRYEGKTFELFNLKDDMRETTDLAAQMPEKVKQLDAQLTAWLKQTNALLPRTRQA